MPVFNRPIALLTLASTSWIIAFLIVDADTSNQLSAFGMDRRMIRRTRAQKSSWHMNDDQEKQRTEADAELEREIRQERKFTLEEAIARLAGPDCMKGASPISRMQQAETEIQSWLRSHLADAGGALEIVLHRNVKGSEILLNNFDQPLVVLAGYCQRVLSSDYLLEELVRDADVEWGRMMGERPFFEKKGVTFNPNDPYTVTSVHNTLSDILTQLAAELV
jgi:hypothetical protein